jgi:enamine deaminase RidA (YjgF/YER057c/UK114 family)
VTLRAIEPTDYPWFPYKGFTFCLGLADGDAAWTSGQSAAVYDEEAGRMVVGGSMGEQTELSYAKLLAVLAEEGLGPPDVVHVTENVTAAGAPSYAEAVEVRRALFGEHEPTVTTVVVDRLVRGKALIELELHAVPGGGEILLPAGAVDGARSPIREGHDGTVHLPTVLPLDPVGAVVHPGDPVAQHRHCLRTALSLIDAAGLSPDDIVAGFEYRTPAAAPHGTTMAEARAEALGSETVGGVVVMRRLLEEDMDVALDLTLSRHPKSVVDPGWARFDGEPVVPALRAGRSLHLSAMAALDRTTGVVVAPGDLGGQAEELYGQMAEVLALAGVDSASLRSTIEFCAAEEIAGYRVVAGVRERYLSPPWPTSTGDLCTGFPQGGLLLQTNAIAHLGG